MSLITLPFVCSGASELGLKTVVIDPGHGGHDPGCVSKDKKTYEKTLALDISKKLAALIRSSCPDVKVLMTRDDDTYVTLNDRAEFANRENADLFISIHINATPSTTPSGCSVHVLGQSSKRNTDLFASNMEICRRENSVIMMEDNYTAKYQGFDPEDPESYIFMQLMQDSYLEQSLSFAQICSQQLKNGPIKSFKGVFQDPFYVLWKTSMPAALVELGFISNQSDLETLRSDSSRTKLAEKLFIAFLKFKQSYDQSLDIHKETVENVKQVPVDARKEVKPTPEDVNKKDETKPSVKTGPAKEAEPPHNAAQVNPTTKYGVQIFCLKTKIPSDDSRLLGYEPVIVPAGKLYKYIISVDVDRETVSKNLSKIRKTYPEAYIVTL